MCGKASPKKTFGLSVAEYAPAPKKTIRSPAVIPLSNVWHSRTRTSLSLHRGPQTVVVSPTPVGAAHSPRRRGVRTPRAPP